MPFGRVLFSADSNLGQPLRAGDGFVANVLIKENAADAALVLTVADVAGGFVTQTTTLTADRIFTTPTAALLAADFPTMDVGDSFVFVVSSAQTGAFDIILAGGTGVTLKGAGNVGLQSSRTFVLVKTAAATFDLY